MPGMWLVDDDIFILIVLLPCCFLVMTMVWVWYVPILSDCHHLMVNSNPWNWFLETTAVMWAVSTAVAESTISTTSWLTDRLCWYTDALGLLGWYPQWVGCSYQRDTLGAPDEWQNEDQQSSPGWWGYRRTVPVEALLSTYTWALHIPEPSI